jgi:hypothetical protein
MFVCVCVREFTYEVVIAKGVYKNLFCKNDVSGQDFSRYKHTQTHTDTLHTHTHHTHTLRARARERES